MTNSLRAVRRAPRRPAAGPARILAWLCAAALAWLGAEAALAAEETRRVPIVPFVSSEAGTYFDFTGRLQTKGDFARHALQFYRSRDSDGARSRPIRTMTLDELARAVVVAYESYHNVLLQMKFAHEVYNKPQLSRAETARIRHVVTYPDGSSETVSYDSALLLYYGMLQLLDAELQNRDAGPDIAGSYAATVSGDCPFDTGPLQLAQIGHYVEGRRGRELLLMGAAGAALGWFVTSETRYGTVRKKSGLFGRSFEIEAPDAPSELYRGPLGAGALDLAGTVRGTCRITLRRARP